MFHIGHGWFFERKAEGWVMITKRERADPESPVVVAISIAPDSWASMVASVCVEGDNAETFQLASNLHKFGQCDPPEA